MSKQQTKQKESVLAELEQLSPTVAILLILEMMKELIMDDEEIAVDTKKRFLLLYLQFKFYHSHLENAVKKESSGLKKLLSKLKK